MKEPKQGVDWKRGLIPVGLMLIFVVLGYWGGTTLANSSFDLKAPGDLGLVSAILTALAAIYLVILTHELGHLTAGKLAGMRPILLVVGPLKLTASNNGWKIELNTNMALAGGLAACMPLKTENLKNNFLLMIAGGPFTSLLGGLLGFVAYKILPDSSYWNFFSLLFGVTAAAIFLVTMIPAKTSGFMTDGAQLLSLLRGGLDVEQRTLFVVLQAESMKGVRPRDYSPEIIQRLLSIKSNPMMDASVHLIAYYYHLDRGDIEQAWQSLQNTLVVEKQIPEGMKQALYLEYAFFLAALRADAQSARQYLQKSAGALVEKQSILRAEAAVLFAEGNVSEAREKAMQALKHTNHTFDVGGAIAEREWLNKYIN